MVNAGGGTLVGGCETQTLGQVTWNVLKGERGRERKRIWNSLETIVYIYKHTRARAE